MTSSSLNNLTDAEINERIAVACGWKHIRTNTKGVIIGVFRERCCAQPVPLFATSLDAMAEAEATLTDDQLDEYCQQISELLVPEVPDPRRPDRLLPRPTYKIRRALATATARQRAEAFLLTIAP